MYCVVIFEYFDYIGYIYKWEFKEYYEKLDELDGYLGEIVVVIEEVGMMDEIVIILIVDYGGIGINYGGKMFNEMEILFVFYGKGVKKNYKIIESMMVIDVFVIEVWLLGVEFYEVWLGNLVIIVFFIK